MLMQLRFVGSLSTRLIEPTRLLEPLEFRFYISLLCFLLPLCLKEGYNFKQNMYQNKYCSFYQPLNISVSLYASSFSSIL